MILKIHFLVRLFLVLSGVWGCSQSENSSRTGPAQRSNAELESKKDKDEDKDDDDDDDDEEKDSDDIWDEDPRASYRRHEISAYELDDRKFALTGIAVGIKDFMRSESPIISYNLPKASDYVEILRCKSNALIATATDQIALEDVGLTSSSLGSSGANFLRNNDFFRAASETSGCEQLSLGTINPEYVDSAAFSGDYRYILRSCVARERLTDTEDLTKRNCSKQVGISDSFSYENSRKDEEREAIRKMNVYGSKVDAIFWNMKMKAEEYVQEIERCTDRETERAIDMKVKEAAVTMISTAADLSLEFATAQVAAGSNLLEHYTVNAFSNKMDVFQLFAALGGLSFKDMLIKLTLGSEDTPRSCARLQAISAEMETLSNELGAEGLGYHYWKERLRQIASGEAAVQGDLNGSQAP